MSYHMKGVHIEVFACISFNQMNVSLPSTAVTMKHILQYFYQCVPNSLHPSKKQRSVANF